MKPVTFVSGHIGLVVIAAALSGCGSGPSDSEFVQACLREGGNVASQMLDRELGVDRETMCKCAAGVAKATLSAEGLEAMTLDMKGEKQAAAAITAKMNEDEQMAFVSGTMEVFGKCAGGLQ